jgi:hypothetical protein
MVALEAIIAGVIETSLGIGIEKKHFEMGRSQNRKKFF